MSFDENRSGRSLHQALTDQTTWIKSALESDAAGVALDDAYEVALPYVSWLPAVPSGAASRHASELLQFGIWVMAFTHPNLAVRTCADELREKSVAWAHKQGVVEMAYV